MESDKSKLCIFCCSTFASNDQVEHAQKISKLYKGIFERSNFKSISTDVFCNEFKFYEKLEGLNKDFNLSICSDCLRDMSELIKSFESMNLLEDHVIELQLQIIKGLRELEECQKLIKCHQEKIKINLDTSNVSCLEKRCLPDVNVNQLNGTAGQFNFVLKLRRCIVKDALQYKKRKLKGNLSISPTEDKQEQVIIKHEEESKLEHYASLDDYFFDSWDLDQDLPIKTDNQQSGTLEKTKLKIKKDPSTMTLRKRKATIQNNPVDSTIIPAKRVKKSSKAIKTQPKNSPKPSKKSKPTTNVKPACHFCELCPFNTNDVPAFEQHLKEHEDPNSTNLLKCFQCPSKFSTNQYFQFHQKIHQDHYKMSCDICSQLLPVLSLSNHIKSHYPPNPLENSSPKFIFCQNCSFCCTTTQGYVNHCRRHYISKTARFPCSICSEELNSPFKLIQHYSQVHKDIIEMWTCDVENCSKKFPSKDTMLSHKLKTHGIKSKTVPCADPTCDKMFSTEICMKVHFQKHSGGKPFACEKCGARYITKEGVNAHCRRVHGAAKPKCKICGIEFFTPRTLKAHMAMHANKGLPCKICGKTFWSKIVLKEHLWTHSEEVRWTCEQCGKGFKTRDGWKGHMANHEERKNWKCEYCGKGFVRKSNLKDHLRVHTGERPYICDVCGKDFNQASALRTHKSKQHDQ